MAAKNIEASLESVTQELPQGGYEVSEYEARIDLRGRKQIGIRSFMGSELSETRRLTRMVFKKLYPNLKNINIRHATSGVSIEPLEIPPGSKFKRLIIEEQSSWIKNPFTDLLTGKKAFRELLARSGAMRTYYLIMPVSLQVGNELTYKLKYNNSFQGKDFEWAGVAPVGPTDRITLKVTFPENKPFKSYETFKKISCETADKSEDESTTTHNEGDLQSRADQGQPECNAEKVKIADPEIEFSEDHLALTWNIRNARGNELYLIKWIW
ncbi:MAG: hypothetical protein IH886_10360 [Nitrospinae bacterium]|nr:hypothetical protein [Nitrospinota bacterium]